MDLKGYIAERTAAIYEQRLQAKLEQDRLPQIELPVDQPEEIERQTPKRAMDPVQNLNAICSEKYPPHRKSRIIKLKVPNEKLQEILRSHLHPSSSSATKNVSGVVAKKQSRLQHGGGPANEILANTTPAELGRQSSNDSELQRPPKKAKSSSDAKTKAGKANNISSVPKSRPNIKMKSKELKVIETRKMPPEWYTNANENKKFSEGDLQKITHVKTIITNYIEAINDQGCKKCHFEDLRNHLQEMEFYPFLTEAMIKKSNILEADGLLQIFDGPNKGRFPWDIQLDAEALWRRWKGREFDGHLMRGIQTLRSVTEKGKKHISYRLDKTYTEKKSSNTPGGNSLINGQWWPNQLCALRDGAHGEREAGIHGQTGSGAFSVVVSAGYADIDHGEEIQYFGTTNGSSTPTKGTSLMFDSYLSKQPVRVLRAANKNSKYAPKEGIRYDGLYSITTQEVLDLKTALYRFTMKRISGQDPIRWRGVEVKPTNQELKERMRIRKLLR